MSPLAHPARTLAILAASLLPACQSARAGRPAGENLPPGPYASVGQVPVPELPAFAPELPRKAVLDNGVTVLLMPDASRPLVEFTLFLRAGSFDDPPGHTGLADLTASVLRTGGSGQLPGDRLDAELAELGAEIGFQVRDDRSEGSLRCLKEDFERVFGMFLDVLEHPAFPGDKVATALDRMRADVLERNDDPRAAASREARRAFFGPDDPRSRRVEMADLDAVGREDLEAFHRRHFGSHGALVAVYGDFEPEAMLRRLESGLGGWPAQPAAAAEAPAEVPAPAARRVILAARPDVNQAEVRLIQEGVRLDDPDYPALWLGSFVFGTGGFSSRMISHIRTELGLAYTTGALWQPSLMRQGLFWGWCGTKNRTCALAVKEMLAVLEGFLADGAGEAEFEGARQRLLNSQVFRFDTRSKVLLRIAALEFAGYPWDFDRELVQRLKTLTASDVLEACRRRLQPGRLTIFVMGNPEAFDEPLERFGPVESWELEAAAREAAGPGAPPAS